MATAQDPLGSGVDGASRLERSLTERWQRVGAACGVVAVMSYAMISAVPLTDAQGLVIVCLFGPTLAGASMGLYHVLRLHRRAVTSDLGVVANIAAGVTVTLMFLAQLGQRRWFEMQFGEGAIDSSDRLLHVAFESGNGIQLGLDVAWDLFIGLGTGLFALNMWHHPRFGRPLAISGVAVAVALVVLNVAAFPEPPGEAGSIDLGPLVGLWYLLVTTRLARSGRWVAAAAVSEARQPTKRT